MLWILIRSALLKALLMSTHNICFYGDLEKIIPKLSSGTPSNNSSINSCQIPRRTSALMQKKDNVELLSKTELEIGVFSGVSGLVSGRVSLPHQVYMLHESHC